MNNSEKRVCAGKRNIRHLHLGMSRADDAFKLKYKNCTDCDHAANPLSLNLIAHLVQG